MLKKSGINQRRDDEMNDEHDIKPLLLVVIAVCLAWLIALLFFGKLVSMQEEKAALEIKILQHELSAYEAMEKELGNEPTIEP